MLKFISILLVIRSNIKLAGIVEQLNEEQRRPALKTEGPVLVTAGAGSGKTRLLTHRIAHLVQDLNVSPSNILAITFTNKASNEMKERLSKLLSFGVQGMWIFTFHAMCSRILRINGDRVGLDKNFSIYGDSEKDRLIKRVLQSNPEYVKLEKNKLKPESVAWHISNAKNELLSPDAYAVKIKRDNYVNIIIKAYEDYQRELLIANAVDFDDMLCKTYELLVNNDDVRAFYQEKFRYIHVDEFQDTNVVQYELVRLLGAKYRNIFAVGDEDQCIYSWRGAKFTNVQKFIDDNKDIAIFKLEQNYRSTSKILDAANKIIKNNSNRLEKNLWTENDGGRDIKLYTGYSDHEEAEFVASKIKKMVMEEDYRYSDFAVLMRINSLSRLFEEKFLNYQIPYQVYGGFKFFERKEVKDTLAYLKMISNPKDNDSFVRVLAFPKKGIGEASVKKLLDASSAYGLSAFEVAKSGIGLDEQTIRKLAPVVEMIKGYLSDKESLSISVLTNKIVDECGLKTAYSREIEEELSKIQNIEMLQKSVLEYEEANDGGTLEDYLQSVTLSRDIDELDSEDNNVSIMTIHSAKGLEFKVVFVVGLVEGVLPTSRAIYSTNPNDLEEERRLMYVATTRAKEELIYTRPTSRFSFETKRTEATSASRFLKESGIKAIETTPRKEYGSDYATERERFYSSSNYSARRDDVGMVRYRSEGVGFTDDNDIVAEEKPKVTSEKINEYKRFKVGTIVSHKSFGRGIVTVAVTDVSSGFITIKFDNVGIKTLSLKFAPLTIVEE